MIRLLQPAGGRRRAFPRGAERQGKGPRHAPGEARMSIESLHLRFKALAREHQGLFHARAVRLDTGAVFSRADFLSVLTMAKTARALRLVPGRE